MDLRSVLRKPALAIACIGLLGSATPAFSGIPTSALNYRERLQGTGNATRVITNTQPYALILDVLNIQSSTGEPVFLQVHSAGVPFDATSGPAGNYGYLMTGQWPPVSGPGVQPVFSVPSTYFCTVNTAIVILPGDSFRGYSLNGAQFSISISGHYNFNENFAIINVN